MKLEIVILRKPPFFLGSCADIYVDFCQITTAMIN